MVSSFLNWWRQVFNLCHKELLVIFKDPANRIILVVPVIIQAVLFGYGATFDLEDAPYAVLDQSRAAASTQILAKIDSTGVFRRVADVQTPREGGDWVVNEKALLFITFPADFENRIAAGEAAPLQVIVDGRNSTTAGVAVAQLNAVVMDFNRANGIRMPVSVENRFWFNPNQETRWMIMPAMIASMSMIQVIMLAALAVAREREQGTFDQLLVTPATPAQIMIGKAVPSVFIGLLQSLLCFVIILYWFAVPFSGSLMTLTVMLVLFNIAIVGIGLSISALSLNMQQAMLYTFVLLMPMILLSGLASPIENMPEIMQIGTYANPLRFAVDMTRRIYLEGAVLRDILYDFIPLVVTAVLTLPLAAWLFRHRLA